MTLRLPSARGRMAAARDLHPRHDRRAPRQHPRRPPAGRGGRRRRLTFAQAAKRGSTGGPAASRAEVSRGEPWSSPPRTATSCCCCASLPRAPARIPVPVNAQMRPDEIDHVVSDSRRRARRARRAPSSTEPSRSTSRRRREPGRRRRALLHVGHDRASRRASSSPTARSSARSTAAARCPGRPAPRRGRASRCRSRTSWASPRCSGSRAPASPCYFLPEFRPSDVLDAIEQRRATIFIGVPAMYRMLLEAGAERPRPQSRCARVGSGADAMPAELARRFKQHGRDARRCRSSASVGEALFVEGYGMVEIGGGVAAEGLAADARHRPRRVARHPAARLPVPGRRRRRRRGRAPARSASCCVKGPGVLEGLLGRRRGDRDALTDDGWLRTGDLARKGLLGTVVFAGRQEGRDQARRLLGVRARGRARRSRSIPTCSRPRCSACPTSARARSRRRRARSSDGADLEPPTLVGVGRGAACPTTRCRSSSSSSTSCPAPAPTRSRRARWSTCSAERAGAALARGRRRRRPVTRIVVDVEVVDGPCRSAGRREVDDQHAAVGDRVG